MKLKLLVDRKYLGLCTLAAVLVFSVAWLVAAPAAAQEEDGRPTPATSGRQSYLPLIARSLPKSIPLAGDLVLDGFENTQTIQNNVNNIPLITGKNTVMRIFARTTTGQPVKSVWVSLTATQNNRVLAGSPLLVGPGSVPTAWERGNITTSFNAVLPAEWLYGDVSIAIQLDAKNNYIESNEGNNLIKVDLHFHEVPPLEVKVVPVQYNDPTSGLSFSPPSSDFVAAALLKVYPVNAVNVTRREQIGYGQDLTDPLAWEELLNRLTDLKRTDRAPFYQVYYGLVPLVNSSGNTWFDGGTIGMGWVGNRVSVGLTDINLNGLVISAADIAGHEIGHNLGREHSPCAVYPFDRKYPYKDGSIGQYGFNTSLMQVLAPEIYTDIMGYCSVRWVSDYTYAGLYLNQSQYGGPLVNRQPAALEAAVPGLLVRASVKEDGELQLRPFYQFSGDIDPPAAGSPYRLEYLDESGGIVASYPLAELRAEEPQLKVISIISLAPLPEKPYVAVRLSRQEQATGMYRPVAEKPLSTNTLSRLAAPSLQSDAERLVIQWGAPQVPTLVRYSIDGGQRWTTVALDALGGQLVLDRNTLPAGDLLFELVLADSNTIPYRLEWRNQP